jgi:hypothetical protein
MAVTFYEDSKNEYQTFKIQTNSKQEIKYLMYTEAGYTQFKLPTAHDMCTQTERESEERENERERLRESETEREREIEERERQLCKSEENALFSIGEHIRKENTLHNQVHTELLRNQVQGEHSVLLENVFSIFCWRMCSPEAHKPSEWTGTCQAGNCRVHTRSNKVRTTGPPPPPPSLKKCG